MLTLAHPVGTLENANCFGTLWCVGNHNEIHT